MCGNDIEYIKNVTTFASFDNNNIGEWTHQLNNLPSSNPDVCIVRGITFLNKTDPAPSSLYLIWCSLINGYIGSDSATSNAGSKQEITIHLNSVIGNHITFQIHAINEDSTTASLVTDVQGQIIIHMDFIKYKNTPPHA